MKVLTNRLRFFSRGKSRRPARPSIEGLEDRFLLYAAIGGKFAFGSRITYSFVPDGTNLGGPTSNLFSSMDAKFSRAAWQAAFTYAAATWSSIANINIVQVADNGASLGTYGYQQGDSRFGDIRIGGLSMSNTTMATTFSPPPFNGGTLAGDMIFNTSLAWQINHDYDLQTVAIHEFGHALGLDHTAVAGSQMGAVYDGVQQSLSTDDVNGMRSIWGARAPDWSSQGGGNFTPATATNPMQYMNSNNQITLYDLNITSNSDQHWYKIVTPPNVYSYLSAGIQSTNLSMLSPKIQIYNASLVGMAQALAPNSFGGFAAFSVNVTPNTTYYIRTSAAQSGISGAGNYALLINMGSVGMGLAPPPNTTVAWQPDQGGGSIGLIDGPSPGKAQPGASMGSSHDQPEIISIGSLSGFGCELKISKKLNKPDKPDKPGKPKANEVLPEVPATIDLGTWAGLGMNTGVGAPPIDFGRTTFEFQFPGDIEDFFPIIPKNRGSIIQWWTAAGS